MAMTSSQIAEIERKARLGEPLAGDKKGYVSPESLAYWQQQMSANAARSAADTSNQSTGGGVGSSPPIIVNNPYPANDLVPSITKDAITGYGFTAIVGIGVAIVVLSLLSSFRRVRGR